MAQQTIDVGTTPNDGTGDSLRGAFVKTNANFDELYAYSLLKADSLSGIGSAPTARTNIAAAHDRLTVLGKSSSFTVALTDFETSGVKTNPEYHVTNTATATLKQDSDENIPVGYIGFFRVDTGVTLTFAAGTGATVTTTSGGFTLVGPDSPSGGKTAWAMKTAADEWFVNNGDPPSGSFTEFVLQGFVATYTNMPSGAQEIAAGTTGRYRTKVDLTNFSSIRCCASVSVVGATNAGFYLDYSTDQSSWTTLGAASGSDIARIGDAIGASVSAWITLPAGAKGDVWLRGNGVAGDGAADPVVGRVTAQVK